MSDRNLRKLERIWANSPTVANLYAYNRARRNSGLEVIRYDGWIFGFINEFVEKYGEMEEWHSIILEDFGYPNLDCRIRARYQAPAEDQTEWVYFQLDCSPYCQIYMRLNAAGGPLLISVRNAPDPTGDDQPILEQPLNLNELFSVMLLYAVNQINLEIRILKNMSRNQLTIGSVVSRWLDALVAININPLSNKDLQRTIKGMHFKNKVLIPFAEMVENYAEKRIGFYFDNEGGWPIKIVGNTLTITPGYNDEVSSDNDEDIDSNTEGLHRGYAYENSDKLSIILDEMDFDQLGIDGDEHWEGEYDLVEYDEENLSFELPQHREINVEYLKKIIDVVST